MFFSLFIKSLNLLIPKKVSMSPGPFLWLYIFPFSNLMFCQSQCNIYIDFITFFSLYIYIYISALHIPTVHACNICLKFDRYDSVYNMALGCIYIHIKKNVKKNSLGVLRSTLQGKSTSIEHHNLTPYFREGLMGFACSPIKMI